MRLAGARSGLNAGQSDLDWRPGERVDGPLRRVRAGAREDVDRWPAFRRTPSVRISSSSPGAMCADLAALP